ncbi:hypothetical protein [Tenacibaculum sp. Bg11-29]|nr:hypothetical protein [Tenacibaculum sp. Bg11-29]
MFSVVFLSSCTDNTDENLVEEKDEIQLIDKDDIEEPNDRDND